MSSAFTVILVFGLLLDEGVNGKLVWATVRA